MVSVLLKESRRAVGTVILCAMIPGLFISYGEALEIEKYPSWSNKTPGWTSKLQLADINNDGYLDLIAANYIRGEGYTKENTANIKIYMNHGGVFEEVPSQVLQMPKNVGSWNIALGDYDNDGDLDLAVGNVFEQKDLIFENAGGVFKKKPVWLSDDRSVSHGLHWVDYDQDGDLDLSVSAAYSGAKIYENINGKISTHAKWESCEVLDFQDLAWADMDRDGDLDLAVANHNDRPPGGIFIYKSVSGSLPRCNTWLPGKVRMYLSASGYSSIKTLSWWTDAIKVPGRLAWGDVDGDGFPELSVSNGDGPTMVFENVKGELTKTPFWESSDQDNSFDLVFADMDNGGLTQALLTLRGADIKNVVYLPHAPIHAIKSVLIDSKEMPRAEYCYNLKDGWVSFNKMKLQTAKEIKVVYVYSTDLDLVVAKSTWQGSPEQGKADRIYLNHHGVLNREAEWQTENKTLSTAVAVGDVDNDGDLDVVFGGEVGWKGKTKVPQHIYLYLNHTVE